MAMQYILGLSDTTIFAILRNYRYRSIYLITIAIVFDTLLIKFLVVLGVDLEPYLIQTLSLTLNTDSIYLYRSILSSSPLIVVLCCGLLLTLLLDCLVYIILWLHEGIKYREVFCVVNVWLRIDRDT